MKFFLLAFAMLAISSNIFSAVDYSYCQQQFNLDKASNKPCQESNRGIGLAVCVNEFGSDQKDSSYFPFELTSDGKIKPHPLVNYKTENGNEILTSKDKILGFETTVTKNEKGEIVSIDTSYETSYVYGGGAYGEINTVNSKAAHFASKSESRTKIEIKNGKCFPSRIDTINSIGDESRQDVSFDAKLCRNVQQFFKKHPEASSCFDSGLMKKAENIFSDYYKDNKDIYGEYDSKKSISAPRPLGTHLKSDLFQTPAYGFPGTGAYGAVGLGMTMGMPGATIDQRLKPMVPTFDSILNEGGIKAYAIGGFGISPVVQAMQIMNTCQGLGFGGPHPLQKVVNDDTIWQTESSSNSKEEKTAPK
jgi:hypothetical protein